MNDTVSYLRIGYLSEIPEEYAKALDEADTLPKLRDVVQLYRRVTDDAFRTVEKMDEATFADWRKGLKSERRGRFAGEPWMERFADVMLPRVMFTVSQVASQFFVPWGCAYIRMRDAGRIEEVNRIARVVPAVNAGEVHP